MDPRKGKPLWQVELDEANVPERRRVARIVHDHKGNAKVMWVDAPPDFKRPPLSVESDTGVRSTRDGYNPYERVPRTPLSPLDRPKSEPARGGKRDLKALSEWIKKMRELEERRRRGDSDE